VASEIAEQLRATPLFAELADEYLERLAAQVIPMALTPGELLITEGEEAHDIFIVLEGDLEVTKVSGNAEMFLTRVGPGAIQGELAALSRGRRSASVRALTPVRVLRIPTVAVGDLLAAGTEPVLALIRTIIGRLRGMEEALRQREKLAGLGTMAAGLAHELNNPAAAIRRSVVSLGEAIEARNRAAEGIVAELPQVARLVAARPAEHPGYLDALTRSDRADEIASVLRERGLSESDDPDRAASQLVAVGWKADELGETLEGFGPGDIGPAVGWLSSVAAGDELLSEVRMAAERIAAIVGAVKGYAFLDQAPIQRFDVCKGLDDTLLILAHKLRGIEVTRDYGPDLPEIEGWGLELNQVWTNLLDNAADAMDGKGAIVISSRRTDADGIRITICDSGPGIPPDVLPRIFEPFFTTKEPGKGTGLGLHMSHNIVVQHNGTLEVESEPGRTCFEIVLPPTLKRPD
jgi:signal transduction histidine kinase